jgi:hypothetical protein
LEVGAEMLEVGSERLEAGRMAEVGGMRVEVRGNREVEVKAEQLMNSDRPQALSLRPPAFLASNLKPQTSNVFSH